MQIPRRTFVTMAGAAALAATWSDRATGAQIIGGPAFGSWWRASLPQDCDAEVIRAAIFRVVDTIDATMSPYRADTELSLLNRAGSVQWLDLSPEIAPVIRESLAIARMTDGAFDPTVGPLVRRFGFGPIRGSTTASFRTLELRQASIRKTETATTLDLCALAKGRALDRMAQAVEAHGARSFLLEAGGEVLASGTHPENWPWQIAIEASDASTAAAHRIVRLDGGLALATSGPAIQGGSKAGFSYGHIVDAQTGRPVSNGVASVSVITASAMRADALATAMVVMGPDSGLELARRLDLAVLFQLRDGEKHGERMSDQFARYIVV